MERLLDYFKPINYKLHLFIDKHKGSARGRVEISGEALSDIVKLHAKNLIIEKVLLDGKRSDFEYKNDLLSFKKSNNITIDYNFELNTNMMGCYLSSYEYDGKEELIVSTQFESHYARECFPCIDEPAAKATFDLKITVPDIDDVVIANTPVKSYVKNLPAEPATLAASVESENPVVHENSIASESMKPAQAPSKTLTFETTPKMSTYLLAFCIGRFHSKSTKSKHGVEVTTYCALNQDLNSVDFANQIAADVLDYYDDRFGLPYPLKKLDQIAIPDFEAGAMENWGLVTYRESCLLSGPTATIDDRQYVATVVAHELSHQWFGDLVTMEWWDDLWLNESFATIMEYLAVDAIRPDYKILENFFIGECRAALNRDALPGVQAVKQDVNDPAEIATLFDGAIVYAKGARLMFMLYRLMGENFFKGLKDYFKKHQYGNTTGDDLWAALAPYADFDVKTFMNAWISQPGFPVLTDDHQMRFLLTGATDDTTWPLPEVSDDMSGHYLLNLSAEEFAEKLAHFDDLNFERRIRLLLDRSLLSKTTIVSTALHFDLLPHFRSETDQALWGPISGLISDLKLFFPASDSDFAKFQQYIYYIIESQLTRLGLEPRANEPENDIKLRPTILSFALFAEKPEVLASLAEIYDRTVAEAGRSAAKTVKSAQNTPKSAPESPLTPSNSPTALLRRFDPETRYAALYAKLRQNESEFWPILLDFYQKTADPDLRNDLLSVLASAKNHTKDLLDLLKQPKIVRPQDHLFLFIFLLRNRYTQTVTLQWLYKNWAYVEEMNGEKSIEDYPRYAASVIRTQERADEFNEFFAQFADRPVLKRALKVAKSEINARLRLILVDNADVHAAFKKLKF